MEYVDYMTKYAIIPEDAVDPTMRETAEAELALVRRQLRFPIPKIKWFVEEQYAREMSIEILGTSQGWFDMKYMVVTKKTPHGSVRDDAIYLHAGQEICSLKSAVRRCAVLAHMESTGRGVIIRG